MNLDKSNTLNNGSPVCPDAQGHYWSQLSTNQVHTEEEFSMGMDEQDENPTGVPKKRKKNRGNRAAQHRRKRARRREHKLDDNGNDLLLRKKQLCILSKCILCLKRTKTQSRLRSESILVQLRTRIA